MVDSVSPTVAGVKDTPFKAQPAAAAAGTNAPSDFAQATEAASTATAVAEVKKEQVAPISPRLRTDFSSGALVTEFVDSKGTVSQQAPSNAALAYLRAGLDVHGEKKVDPNAEQPKPATDTGEVIV